MNDRERSQELTLGFPLTATVAEQPAARRAGAGTSSTPHIERRCMSTFTTKDGTQLYYKDWGTGRPVVFSHGWPLSGDAWEAQMFHLASNGFRCIAHDRRGHGRSSQPWDGNHMDQYADDLAELMEALELRNVLMVGHSTGGGEVARYIGRHGTKRVAKAVLMGAVPPIMAKTAVYPGGLSMEVFDGFRKAYLADRSQFFSRGRKRSLLQFQPSRREAVPGNGECLVATGNDVRPQERLRLHQGVLGN